MPTPLLSYLKWVVRDPISGSILIDPLPHPHQSSFKTYIAQAGTAGSSVIGTFDIPLFGPGTAQYRWAKIAYDQLGLNYMQRVEAYMTNTPVDTPGILGDPVFSGIITKLPQDLTTFALSGYDSLKLAELARTGRMETFSGRTDQLFSYALKVYGFVFIDDFTGTTLNNYTNTGTWSLTTDQSYNAIQAAQAVCTLTSNASFANSNYADCAVTADFHTIGPTTSGNPAQTVSVVAASTIKGNATVTFQSNTSHYQVDISITDTGTTKASIANVISDDTTGEFHLQLRLIGVQNGSSYTWRLLLNGTDYNCTYTYTATPSGTVGLVGGNVLASTKCWVHGAPGAVFMLENKTSIFQPGQIIRGNQSINQVLSLQAPIDLYNLAMSTEDAQYRKNPKAGLNNDTLDFNAPVGTNLAASIRFEEGVNLENIKLEPNAEPINTALIAASPPGPDHQGIHWRYNASAIKRFGLLYGVAPVHSSVHHWALRRQADSILINRSTPQQAKTLTVLRDADQAAVSQTNNTTGLRYREGDLVTIHVPRLGIFNQTSQILGFTFKEGAASMEVVLDQYPGHLDRIIRLDRLRQTVEHLMTNSEEVSGFQSGAGVIFDRRVVLATNPFRVKVKNNANQTLNQNTFTKVSLQEEIYDISQNFDSTTNYRFTAPVSAYYFVSGSVSGTLGSQTGRVIAVIYKNGVEVGSTRGSQQQSTNNASWNLPTTSTVIYLYAGDYLELFAWQNGAVGAATIAGGVGDVSGDYSTLTIFLHSI